MKYTKEQLEQARKETYGDVSNCCDYWNLTEYGDEVNGICPDCGRATVDGQCVYGCNYSPVMCETCGSAPCDYSC